MIFFVKRCKKDKNKLSTQKNEKNAINTSFTQSYPHFKLPLLLDFIRVCVSYPHYPHYYYYMCSAHFVHTSQSETQGTHSLKSLTTLLTFECFCVDTQTHFAIYGSILPLEAFIICPRLNCT